MELLEWLRVSAHSKGVSSEIGAAKECRRKGRSGLGDGRHNACYQYGIVAVEIQFALVLWY